jgi:hypothetical protein
MLRWSEVEPGAFHDPKASSDFDRDDSSEYEAKVAGLLRRARERANPSAQQMWADATNALKGRDYYLLVMLRQTDANVPNKIGRQSSLRDNLIYLAVGLSIAAVLFYYVVTQIR